MTIQQPKEKPTFSISFSEYSTFMQCPHKWFLNYMLKIPSDTNEELIFGSSVHDTIETLLTTDTMLVKMAKRDIGFAEGIFKGELKKQIQSINDVNMLKKMNEGWVLPTFVKQAMGLLRELKLFTRWKDYEVVDVEIKLDGLPIIECEDVTIVYKGFIDLVLRHKVTGRYLILDWKTSRKAWDINAKEEDPNFYTQLKLYKHFYSMKKGIPMDMIDLCFYNLPREVPQQQKQYDKVIEEAEISDFMKMFSNNCENIYRFNHFKLNKMRFLTKKNYCGRCPYNNINHCNTIDEFQLVEVPKL